MWREYICIIFVASITTLLLSSTGRSVVYCEKQGSRIDYCKKLDSVVWERYFKTGDSNFSLIQLRVIPVLEKKTGYKAHFDLLGFSGAGYKSDSVFNTDIRMWAEKLGCRISLPTPRPSTLGDSTSFFLDN